MSDVKNTLVYFLDPELNFTLQAEYAVGKAKRSASQVYRLIDGDRGIPVRIGIELYKSLVRPHLEYALPVWASLGEKDLSKLEKVQTQCLKRIIGTKAHSSSSAVEVVAGVLPFRFRKRELCCREFVRIKCKDEDHILVKLLNSSTRKGMRFCTMEHIRVMSKELERKVSGYNIERKITTLCLKKNVPPLNCL